MRPSGSRGNTHKRSDLREDLLVWHSLVVFDVRGHVGFDDDGKEIFADVGSFLQIVRVCSEYSFLLVGQEFLIENQIWRIAAEEEDLLIQSSGLSFGYC